MLIKHVLPFLKVHLQLCKKFCSSPYEWDCKTSRLKCVTSPARLKYIRLQDTITVLYCFLMGLIYIQLRDSLTLPQQIITIAFFLGMITFTVLRLNFSVLRKEMKDLVNGMLSFEEQRFRGIGFRSRISYTMSKYMCLLGTVTAFGFPSIIGLSYIVEPCFPPLLGSMLFTSEDGECTIPNLLSVSTVALVDIWIWLNLTLGVTLNVMHIFSISLNFIVDGTEKVIWYTANNPWRRKTAAHFINYGIRISRTFRLHRELRLVGVQINICFQNLFLPTLLIGSCLELIISIFVCVKLHDQFSQSLILNLFPLVLVDAFVVIFIISSIAAKVHGRSKNLMTKMHQLSQTGRNSWVRKMAKAVAPFSVRLESNFVNDKTPLIILNICLVQAVSVLIASE